MLAILFGTQNTLIFKTAPRNIRTYFMRSTACNLAIYIIINQIILFFVISLSGHFQANNIDFQSMFEIQLKTSVEKKDQSYFGFWHFVKIRE